MKSQITNQDHGCPPKEDLSCWHDNGGDEKIERHVGECLSCVETVGFYRQVDETVRLTGHAPEYLASSILEACHGLEGEVLAFPVWMRVLRIAAVVAVIGTVAATINLIAGTGKDTTGPVKIAEVRSVAPQTPAAIADLRMPASQIFNAMSTGNGDFMRSLEGDNPSNILAVSTRGAGSSHGPRIGERTVANIAQSVRHVWVVDDLDRSRAAFMKSLPAGVKMSASEAGGTSKFSLEAVLTDVQLQQLVNGLEANGWALFTKEYPQPGEEDNVALTGRKVHYSAELVKKAE